MNVLGIGAKAPCSVASDHSNTAGSAMTKALASELRPEGVRVNATLVGMIESGQWRRRVATMDVAGDDFYASSAQTSLCAE